MKKFQLIFLILITLGACQTDTQEVAMADTLEVPQELPFLAFAIDDMADFASPTANWSAVGQVTTNPGADEGLQTEAGTGVLVNLPDDTNKGHLLTAWEHGDIELALDFMMPKGSNSGIYLQGRYEVQLLDSWMKENPSYGDVGGIYERWDESKPEGERGFEGIPPASNAAKAPGLWQHLYIDFRAPRFDEQGRKIEDAQFRKVVLNDVVIHEHVSVSGPTRSSVANDEVPMGPLMIQGDHGPVAFKNMTYKKYTLDEIGITDFQYAYYNIGHQLNQLPDFDTLEVTKSGAADSFNIEAIADQEKFYAIRFTGKLEVTKPGEYILSTISDDGTKLYVDGQLLVENDFNHDMEEKKGLIDLSAGSHDFQLDYYNNQWGKGLQMMYEGPEIAYQPLLSPVVKKKGKAREPLIVEPQGQPELLRGFLNFGNEKRTQLLAVGTPQGIHYAVDFDNGALLKFWRGRFADAGEMWLNRGISQLITPLEMAVEGHDGPFFAVLADEQAAYPLEPQDGFKMHQYQLDDYGIPTFAFKKDGVTVTQRMEPTVDGDELLRTIQVAGNSDGVVAIQMGRGDYVVALESGYYSVGGQYYIKVAEAETDPIVRNDGTEQTLLWMVKPSANVQSLKYQILW